MTDQKQRRRQRTQRMRGGLNPRRGTRDMLLPRAIRTAGHVVPPPALKTISLEYRVQGYAGASVGSPAFISAATLATFLPGTTSAWQALRLIKIELWGPITSQNSVFVSLDTITSSYSVAPDTFEDFGSTTNRAHVCIQPSSMHCLAWFMTSDGGTLFTVGTDSTTTSLLIYQVTVQLLSVEAVLI
jgi:hypothetical protein